jgi:hypothetical protein
MGDQFGMLLLLEAGAETSNISGALETLIWIIVIAIVMVCLFIVAVVGRSAGDKTKT